jgi:hypothetical protein
MIAEYEKPEGRLFNKKYFHLKLQFVPEPKANLFLVLNNLLAAAGLFICFRATSLLTSEANNIVKHNQRSCNIKLKQKYIKCMTSFRIIEFSDTTRPMKLYCLPQNNCQLKRIIDDYWVIH